MMIRKQVQLTARQVAAVRREAARRGISEAAFIRDALERALGRPDRDRRRERLRRVIGAFDSGLPDLAREHDRYLEDAYDS